MCAFLTNASFYICNIWRNGITIVPEQELMYILHIRSQCLRNYHTTYNIQHIEWVIIRESHAVPQLILCDILRICDHLCNREIRRYLWEHFVNNLIQGTEACTLRFLSNQFQYMTLSGGTFKIASSCISNTTVRHCLHSIQMISTCNFRFNLCVIRTRNFRCLYTIVIHMHYFRICQCNIKTT